MRITQILKTFEKFAVDNSPLLLTSIGAVGTIATAVLTGKAAYKAALILNVGERDVDDIPNKEKIQLVWPLFVPPIVSAGLTITCIIAANRIGSRRAAALAVAYTISEKAFDEYRAKVVEKLGVNKERAARDEVAQERINNNPVGNTEVIITGGGDVLCYDVYTGRYFRSDMETLRQAQNGLNYDLLNHGYASLNDFYNNIGLASTTAGDEVGWNSDTLLELRFSTTMSDDQKPCISIEFTVVPVRNYFRTH
jgi:hypothetical protein